MSESLAVPPTRSNEVSPTRNEVARAQSAMAASTQPQPQQRPPGGRHADELYDRDGRAASSASAYHAKRNLEVNGVLSAAGVPQSVIEEILPKISELTKLSLLAERSIADLKEARLEFDKKLKESLTPEQISAYTNFEQSKPFNDEATRLNEFAATAGHGLKDETLQEFKAAVAQAGVFTVIPCLGPFDSHFTPRVGNDDVLQGLKEDSERIASMRVKVIEQLNGKIGGNELSVVDGYFDSRLKAVEFTRTQVLAPFDPVAEMEKRREAFLGKRTKP